MVKKEIVKKRWFRVLAPEIFEGKVIGEALAATSQDLVGKPMNISLMLITGEPQNQNTHLKLKIIKAHEDNAMTEATGYEISKSTLRKFVRKERDKAEDSFETEIKDGKKIRIKPVMVTKAKVSNSVLTSLRNTSKKAIKEAVEKKDFDTIIKEIVSRKMQKDLEKALRKIYPLAVCEIKSIKKL